MSTKQKIRHDSISDIVYKSLFDDIITGRLKPGTRITELEISESRGISRAPVREAISRLAGEGLLRLVPRSGCYVCELSETDINQIFDIRLRLESLALDYAFEKMDPAQLVKLREKFAACIEYETNKMMREEIKLDSFFHAMILEASGSTLLQDMLGRLLARVHVFRSVGSMNPSRALVAMNTHIAIIDAVLNKKRDVAQKLLHDHIEITRSIMIEMADFFKKESRNKKESTGND